jgi:hypothetical protein
MAHFLRRGPSTPFLAPLTCSRRSLRACARYDCARARRSYILSAALSILSPHDTGVTVFEAAPG